MKHTHLISLIEQELVSAVYVVDITRLTREEYLVDAAQFAKLCAERGVFVVTESTVYDLSIDNHRDLFMFQAQYAAKELKMILGRLGGSRKAKARMGLYAGDRVPAGYVVLRDQSTDRLNHYAIYEPQAQIIRLIFAKFLELRRMLAVPRRLDGSQVPGHLPAVRLDPDGVEKCILRVEDLLHGFQL